MRQASLKLKSYAGNLQIIDNSDLGRKTLHFILVSFGILAVFYIIILGNITFNIIERRSADAAARALSNEVLELELAYLKLAEKVDQNLAREMGFQEAALSFTAEKSLGHATGEPLGGIKTPHGF